MEQEQQSPGEDDNSAVRVNRGVGPQPSIAPDKHESRPPVRSGDLSVSQYADGVLAQDRAILARTITLVESNAPHRIAEAQQLLRQLQPHSGRSIRMGITGVPGAGKSTFIEALGLQLLERGNRVAVLAIDPSSIHSGGSILADKTRMEELSRHANAFVRPSPAAGALGGVARKTRETIIVCEAAGFDVILIETVGTGQSEVTVRSMVDFFLLLLITGAGDDLQGIKRGVMEMADAVVINKADGANKEKALAARAEASRALRFQPSPTPGWQTRALACSSLTGEGIQEIWDAVQDFRTETAQSGAFEERRRQQAVAWLHAIIEEQLRRAFYENATIKERLPAIETAVRRGEIPPSNAADELLRVVGLNS